MINNVKTSPDPTVENGQTAGPPPRKMADNPSSTKWPSVSGALSGAIEHMVQQGMSIDLKQVVAVRNAIAEGRYPIDPAKIAEKIVDHENSTDEHS